MSVLSSLHFLLFPNFQLALVTQLLLLLLVVKLVTEQVWFIISLQSESKLSDVQYIRLSLLSHDFFATSGCRQTPTVFRWRTANIEGFIALLPLSSTPAHTAAPSDGSLPPKLSLLPYSFFPRAFMSVYFVACTV